MCAICGATFRPLKFREVTEEDEEVEVEELKKAKDDDTRAPETTTLLVPDGRNRTKSASSHSSETHSLRGARSLNHVGPSDGEHGKFL